MHPKTQSNSHFVPPGNLSWRRAWLGPYLQAKYQKKLMKQFWDRAHTNERSVGLTDLRVSGHHIWKLCLKKHTRIVQAFLQGFFLWLCQGNISEKVTALAPLPLIRKGVLTLCDLHWYNYFDSGQVLDKSLMMNPKQIICWRSGKNHDGNGDLGNSDRHDGLGRTDGIGFISIWNWLSMNPQTR
jgi:hypothetical protein